MYVALSCINIIIIILFEENEIAKQKNVIRTVHISTYAIVANSNTCTIMC